MVERACQDPPEGKDAQLQSQKKPTYHPAGCNGGIRSHRKLLWFFWWFHMAQQQQGLLVCYSRQGKNWPLFGGLSCLGVTQHSRQAQWSSGWAPNDTMRSSGSALDSPCLDSGSQVLSQQPGEALSGRNWSLQGAARVLHQLNQSISVHSII